MNEPQITVELRHFERGKLKAFADVTIPTALGEITLRGFRVIENDGHELWVALPAASYMKNGQIVNKQVLEVTRGLKKQLTDLVLAEYRRSGTNGLGASSASSGV